MSKEGDQWRILAAEDINVATIINSNRSTSSRQVCFHCHQYVEKLLKGRLADYGAMVPEFHNLYQLARMLHYDEITSEMYSIAQKLDSHYILTRYPVNGMIP